MVQSPDAIFAALAEPRRRQIVELLAARGPMNAGEISSRFEVTPAAISQHLKVLRQAKVLIMKRQAQQRIYRIDPAAFAAFEDWLQTMKATWTTRFAQLDALLGQEK